MDIRRRRALQLGSGSAVALALPLPLIFQSSLAHAANQPPKVALVMKSLANEFFLTMENGARADRKSTRLNSSHIQKSRMPSSA